MRRLPAPAVIRLARFEATRRRFIASCFAFAAVASSAACNPTFNWREVRSPDGFAVVLPGRPQTVSREIKLPDATVQMSMMSTGVGATLFAVGTAQLPSGLSAKDSVRQRTIEHLRDALVRNVSGSVVRTSSPTLLLQAGDSRKVLAAEATEITGHDAGGRAVQLAARLFIVDDSLYQLVALGAEREIPADAIDTFFASFRLI